MIVHVVMPAWNEAEGLPVFIRELHEYLGAGTTFFVVDDCSTDETEKSLRLLAEEGFPVQWASNEKNMGHGPSTMRAWEMGLSRDADAIVAIDGDGQFLGSDVRALVEAFRANGVDVAEGCRTQRGDAWFRRVTSFATRLLVWTRCRSWPQDANTPLRVYVPGVLREFLSVIPSDALTPNLLVSSLSRTWRLSILELPVRSIDRRGSVEHGSTWGARRKSLPTKRFIRFCTSATAQWIRTRPERSFA